MQFFKPVYTYAVYICGEIPSLFVCILEHTHRAQMYRMIQNNRNRSLGTLHARTDQWDECIVLETDNKEEAIERYLLEIL